VRISQHGLTNDPISKGHNLLDLMYSDPSRWSLLFQTYVQLTMLQNHCAKTDKPIKLMERSLLRCRQYFYC